MARPTGHVAAACLTHPYSCSEHSDQGADVDPNDIDSSTTSDGSVDGESLEPSEILLSDAEGEGEITLDDLAKAVDKYAAERDEEVAGSQEPREPIKGKEKLAAALHAAMGAKDIPPTGAAQHSFRYWLQTHPEDKAEYEQLKGEKGGMGVQEKKNGHGAASGRI